MSDVLLTNSFRNGNPITGELGSQVVVKLPWRVQPIVDERTIAEADSAHPFDGMLLIKKRKTARYRRKSLSLSINEIAPRFPCFN
ncbi:hypothetical protein [Ruegeria sp.]|uniref:hypothetical protein n=1 Tax=Ruegeria sp. TaxID=1879320 RepID=UPI00232857D7|nr:hypothetical protein [Ruegeria sp.]MDA7967238.1 hypothetical protein [Ruegeria sp.]